MTWKDFILLIRLFMTQLQENTVGYFKFVKKNSCVKKPLNTEVQNRIAKVKIL